MFIIKCNFCKWIEHNSGLSKDLTHLKEIKNDCSICGKPRKFRCPKCHQIAKMHRKNN